MSGTSKVPPTSFTRGKTTFIVAHKFSTIASAEKILLLEDGQVAHYGAHEQLLRESPQYRELYELQFGPKAPLADPQGRLTGPQGPLTGWQQVPATGEAVSEVKNGQVERKHAAWQSA